MAKPPTKSNVNKAASVVVDDEFDVDLKFVDKEYSPVEMVTITSRTSKLKALKTNESIYDVVALSSRELRDIANVRRTSNRNWGPVISRAKDGLKDFKMQTALCIFSDGRVCLVTEITRTE